MTRKITRFLAKKKLGSRDVLYLGNLNAKRDWGHAKDYTEMQWRILQQKKPDYVIATGEAHSVREFINIASKYLGIKIYWKGKGFNEVGYIKDNKNKNKTIIKIDKNYFRPNEVNYLKGNAKKAFRDLNFKPKYSFRDLVKEMLESDLKKAQKELLK